MLYLLKNSKVDQTKWLHHCRGYGSQDNGDRIVDVIVFFVEWSIVT